MTIGGQLYTLLIVDDEERLRKALERSLRQEGYQVLSAASGDEALAVLQVQKVDLLITDLVMPGMDGMTLVRTIRSTDSDMQVIVMTAYGSDESMAEAEGLGVAHYLTKPFDLFHLKSRVKRLLKDSKTTHSGQGSQAFCVICSTAGKTVGEAVILSRKALPHMQPSKLVCTAGKALGAVSGIYQGIWRRFLKTR